MRLLLVAGLIAATPAFGQEHPCRSPDTYEARRCTERLAEATANAAEAREAIEALTGCAETKKKSALAACAADLAAAAHKLATASEVLSAAAHAAPHAAPNNDGGMTRPE